jgi:hypothetical protein
MTAAVDTEVVPGWATGYIMDVPCYWPNCRNEVSWLARQHQCVSGHLCYLHMQELIDRVRDHMSHNDGTANCNRCFNKFPTFDAFLQVVAI